MSAMIATGMFTQKIARHVQVTKKPPSAGPTAVNAPAIPKNIASARPRSPKENVSMTMAIAAGYISAPPTPCNARKPISHASASPLLGVRPHNADAAAKITTPITTMRQCPTVSARRPPNANSAASASR